MTEPRTPRQFIAQLQKSRPPRSSLFIKEPSSRMVAMAGKMGVPPKKLLKQFSKRDWAKHLVRHLRPRFPPELTELLDNGFIAVGDCTDTTPDTQVKDFGTEGYAIVFNIGLVQFLYRIARVLSTRFMPLDAKESPAQGIEDTARFISEIFWWYQQTGHAFGPDYEITEHQIHAASQLCTEAEAFLLAHEIGHIISDLSESANPMVAQIQHNCSEKHYEEYSADAYGLFIAMEFSKEWTTLDVKDYIRYAGIEFSLQIFRVLEQVGFDISTSHPPAENRLNFIRSLMKERFATSEAWEYISSFSSSIEKLFSRIVEIITNPDIYAEKYEKQAMSVLLEVDTLFEACSKGHTPDYITFYNGLDAIFSGGYSHKVLERVAKLVYDFSNLVNGSTPYHVFSGEMKVPYWRNIQKYKLLLGYATSGNIPPPMKILLESALRLPTQ